MTNFHTNEFGDDEESARRAARNAKLRTFPSGVTPPKGKLSVDTLGLVLPWEKFVAELDPRGNDR